MSNIPQLMGGRELEHDLRFSNQGPMSGLVDGVQSTITMAATTTMVFNETSTANEVQMLCSILPVDPGGANRILKLPADVTSGGETLLSLAGRKITIFNAADAYGENIIVQLSDGTFVTQIGYGDSSSITFVSADTWVFASNVLSTTATVTSGDTTEELIPAVAGYHIVPINTAIVAPSGNPADNQYNFKFASGSVISQFASATDVGQDEIVFIAHTSAEDVFGGVGTAFNLGCSDPGTELRVRTNYQLLKADFE